jgi:hypothetical protein
MLICIDDICLVDGKDWITGLIRTIGNVAVAANGDEGGGAFDGLSSN